MVVVLAWTSSMGLPGSVLSCVSRSELPVGSVRGMRSETRASTWNGVVFG